ncbi:hypothetical protein AGOR_G00102070 [Albula goreensis]|uniref:Uncharacterized protein n=1 Tax=Albula goreensis TaxID=1534307 RepID=A0A8T3DG22_9TELE|nr:hypothetical protein AGOR_G00102070 [Albula goreensis]
MRLQEAIRMKTAAMSRRDGPQARLGSRSALSPSPSPASTASFIFSKSTKKVVIETPSSPEAQADLKRSLANELTRVTNPAKTAATDPAKTVKVPPPVARKPSQHPPTNPGTPTESTPPITPAAESPKQDAVPPKELDNVGETPGEQPKEKPNSASADPAGTSESAGTGQVTSSQTS